jgi:GNAT superfamily N-acetyltransferase
VRVANRPGVADVAVEVTDGLQSMGIGTELAARLVERARANGVTLLTATTVWENRPARALLRRLGFCTRASRGAEVELELDLGSASACSQAARASVRSHPMHGHSNAIQGA